jgi:hypothetical protein
MSLQQVKNNCFEREKSPGESQNQVPRRFLINQGYTPGASDNIWSGYWGNDISAGITVYLTKGKGASVNLFTNWETRGSQTAGAGTKTTPGQAFTT